MCLVSACVVCVCVRMRFAKSRSAFLANGCLFAIVAHSLVLRLYAQSGLCGDLPVLYGDLPFPSSANRIKGQEFLCACVPLLGVAGDYCCVTPNDRVSATRDMIHFSCFVSQCVAYRHKEEC